ncbi:MAG TPA: hypothetical protein VES68_03650 [Candidatus Sulfotelmatobacter sp.]|nr:hypothetical protein [Candidatus Sulfotelmatobacter sp.]
MPPVSERLKNHQLVISREFSDEPKDLGDLVTRETETKRGYVAANQAIEFMRTSGIKLALIEFDQDVLHGKGKLTTQVFSEHEKGETQDTLFYNAEMMLRWKKGLLSPTFYALFVAISGDLYEGHIVKGVGQHRKTLSIDLMESRNESIMGTPGGLYVDYGNHYFDLENPGSEILEIKNWAEANIAHLITRRGAQKEQRIY